MSGDWDAWLQAENLAAQQHQLRRIRGGQAVRSQYVDFGSNDYLGLRRHPALSQAAIDSVVSQGLGSGASPVLSGHNGSHRALEQLLAKSSRTDDAIVFTSGYACNVGVLSCLGRPGDAVFSDQLNHASLIDGLRLSKVERFIFRHADVDDLVHQLVQHRAKFRKVLVVTESIFSMDGDAAPLPELVEVCEKYDCALVVDEAHATGVYGESGAGLLEEWKLSSRVFLKLGTLSKSLGCVGGFAAGSAEVIEYLVNHCRSYMFSTAGPAAVMEAASAALRMLPGMVAERQRLRAMSSRVRKELRCRGWTVPEGDSPIVPVIVGASAEALSVGARLLTAGVYVPVMRPPTVAAGTSRLRISLSAAHSEDDVDRLLIGFGKPE